MIQNVTIHSNSPLFFRKTSDTLNQSHCVSSPHPTSLRASPYHLQLIMAPPIYVKGGVWTNVEDQILRAAVSKYGLTQWSRVASLLPKKTAKQAKARWNEYLNPIINRSEWSREDDEKLLELAKLLPHQWRSIAPIMGRTATQCVERYQYLLEAALKGEDEEEDEEEDDLKLAGPGIETLPALGNAFESLPSRPDMEDMDEDEREMLSEAKARLANTQGKKAKRKDRERMLDESKRISLLQKRRELKAAGVNISLELRNRKKRNEFDYNADIPHEHIPTPGLFDVLQEDESNEIDRTTFQKQVNLKGISMKEGEKLKRDEKDQAKRESKRLIKEILAAAEIFSNIAEEQQTKRRKLELPAPGEEVSDEISTRILQKSRKLLLESDTYLKDGAGKPQKEIQMKEMTKQVSKPKNTRRKLTATIHKVLSAVPKPKNNVEIVLPQMDQNEEQVVFLLPQDSQDGMSESLKLLQQVEAEKEKLRRSQVVQRGYTIPNPEELLPVASSLSGLHKVIAEELHALVKSDCTEFEDPSTGYNIVEVVDEQTYEEVLRRISEEANKEARVTSTSIENLPLPHGPEVADQINEVLDRLDAETELAEKGIQEDFSRYEEDVRAKYLKLQESFDDVADTNLDERLHENIARGDEISIDMRSSRLHELVEVVRAAENRCL